MLPFLAKRWFLLTLALGIIVTLLWTEGVRLVIEPVPPRLVVATILFVMSWGLESRRLWQAVTRPGPALWAVAVSYGLLPLLGWLQLTWFALPDYGVGLLIVTTVPATLAASAIWTRLAGGNEATSLLVTMLMTATSWLITSAWLGLTIGAGVQLDVSAMMFDLAVYLVVPVAVGQLARIPLRTRRWADRGKVALGVLSRLLIFVIILQAVVLAADQLAAYPLSEQLVPLAAVAAACVGTHLAALMFGYWGGKLFRFDRANLIAVAFSGSQKTLPVSLFLVKTYFPQYGLAVVSLLFYHVGQLVVDTLIVDVFKAGQPREPSGPSATFD